MVKIVITVSINIQLNMHLALPSFKTLCYISLLGNVKSEVVRHAGVCQQ